ncbi:DUF4124 domain-containing protein [Sulfurivermis fontis]|uniref:DUF4124 domain-containing protein n=1 Tax=Sulfurivermis fontis TaxID=1972068 RepID=UPI000FD9E5DB|nr:DUF4124 domain-containing protein [Sulfurivermis fontis]
MNKGNSFRGLMLAAALLAASAGSLATTMYKWTDSEGNVQYTQTPPPKGSFQKMTPPPAPASEPTPTQATEPAAEQPAAETGQEEAERKRLEAAVAKHNCETARKNLDIYTAFRRVMNDKGEIVTLDDDERAAKIKEANEMIQKYCR